MLIKFEECANQMKLNDGNSMTCGRIQPSGDGIGNNWPHVKHIALESFECVNVRVDPHNGSGTNSPITKRKLAAISSRPHSGPLLTRRVIHVVEPMNEISFKISRLNFTKKKIISTRQVPPVGLDLNAER